MLGLGASALRRYLRDGMPDRAPAIAYYGILSLFPSLLLAFSLIRLLGGDGAAADVAHYAEDHGASGAVADALRSAATTARAAPVPSAGALDAIARRATAGRSLRRRAKDVAWTLVLLVLGIAVIVFLTLSGRFLEDVL